MSPESQSEKETVYYKFDLSISVQSRDRLIDVINHVSNLLKQGYSNSDGYYMSPCIQQYSYVLKKIEKGSDQDEFDIW